MSYKDTPGKTQEIRVSYRGALTHGEAIPRFKQWPVQFSEWYDPVFTLTPSSSICYGSLKRYIPPRCMRGIYEGYKTDLFMKTHMPLNLDRKAQLKKKRDRPMKYEDQREKAILLLLWGRKGWKRYRDLGDSGFSMEGLFEFLRAKREAEKGA